MSERYTRLFSLPEHLYATDSPVLIVAGALLKDNQSGQVLAQLKLQNIGTKTIKAASVEITLLDTAGKPLGGTVDYQYLDLSASRDATFGQKTPIVLPNAATRSFTVRVTELIFADNSDWPGSSAPWEPLLEQERLETALGSEALVTQYQLLYGSCCHYQVLEERGLWRCACGGINRRGEPGCHVCGNRFDALSATTVAKLTAAHTARLTAERRKAAEQRAKNVRILKIAIPVAVVVIAIVAVLCWHSSKDKDTDTGQALDVIQEHSATPVPTMKTPYDQNPVADVVDDFLLPDSSTRYLTDNDLETLTWEELCLARNEIFARHGRIFTTNEIASYFNQKPWYRGTISPESFGEAMLSSIERANIQFIVDYELKYYGGSYY